jgi:hypothetical protein
MGFLVGSLALAVSVYMWKRHELMARGRQDVREAAGHGKQSVLVSVDGEMRRTAIIVLGLALIGLLLLPSLAILNAYYSLLGYGARVALTITFFLGADMAVVAFLAATNVLLVRGIPRSAKWYAGAALLLSLPPLVLVLALSA